MSHSSLVSTRFCHVLINTIHDSFPRSGSVLKQRLDQNFNTLSIFMTKHFKIREWAGSCILERIHPLARVFFAFRGIEYSLKNWYISCPSKSRNTVPFRGASNPHQSIIWIISCLRTIVRTFTRILAPSFIFVVHWYEFLQ